MAQGLSERDDELESYRHSLHLRLRRIVGALVHRTLADRIDQSAVIQDTLLKAHKALEAGSIRSLQSWLHTTLKNTLVDEIRRVARHLDGASLDADCEGSLSRVEAWLAADESTPSAKLIEAERRILVDEMLAKLTAEERRAIELIYFEGKTYKQAAAQAGRSVDAIHGLLCRAVKKIRKGIGDTPTDAMI